MKIIQKSDSVILPSSLSNVSLKRQRYLTAATSRSRSSTLSCPSTPTRTKAPLSLRDQRCESPLSLFCQRQPQQEDRLSTTNSAPLSSVSFSTSHKNADNVIMPKSRTLHMGTWLTPRPIMISMLNNKGVILMERQQYAEARKSLNRALKIAEKEVGNHDPPHSLDDEEAHRRFSAECDETCVTSGHTNSVNTSNKLHCSTCEAEKLSSSSTTISPKDEPSSQSKGNNDKEEESLSTCHCSLTTFHTNDTSEASAPTPSISNLPVPCSVSTTNASGENGTGKGATINPLQVLSSIASTITNRSSSSTPSRPNKHRSEYDEGMDYFRTPFRLNDSTNNNTSLVGTVLFNLARVSHNQGNLDEALGLYIRSHQALERRRMNNCSNAPLPATNNSSSNDDHSSLMTLSILVCVAHIQYMRGEHPDALKTYMAANAYAQSNFQKDSLEVAACLNCIGVLHYVMPTGDDQIALDALQTSLRLRIAHLREDHIDVGTTWNNVGRIFFQQGKYDLAMEAYREALRIRKACQGESVDVAATIFNIGQVYHQQEKRDQALQLYQEFLRLAKSHFGEYHRDVCIVTTCIAQVLHEKKEYEKALKSFQLALRTGRVALGPVHSEIAITLNKMGNLYYETGDLDSALKAYHEGLKIEKVVLEPGNANVYVTYTNIAEIHKQRSEFPQALEYYEQVLDLQKEYQADALDVANTLSSIGYIRHQMEDYENALEVNQECLRLRREVMGDVDEDVASSLTHIALVLLKLERHDIALEVLTEAYRVRSIISKPNTRDLAFTLYNIALIYHHRGSHEEALSFYLATAEVEKHALGNAHRDLSITYYNIGQIYYQRGEMDLALKKFNEALEIEKGCFGPDHPTCARTLNEIGNIHLQLGNLEEMMNCYTKALRIYRSSGMTNERVVVYGLKLWRFDVVQPAAAPVA